jgi:S-adenosylmethionine:tRNA ribosyltransferase-isomerase
MMTNPRNISIEDYTYELPDSRIALYPEKQRDESKLLVYKDGNIKSDVFKNISSHLPHNSLLVLNNTRVVEARIMFYKSTGARIEIFCIEPDNRYHDITTALSQTKTVFWKCMVGRASSWTHQTVLEKNLPGNILLSAKIIEKESDHFVIQLSWTPEDHSFSEILHIAGATPLPPYIKRKADLSDAERYQTVYAKQSGSVAAPTAGLHFTPSVLRDLTSRSITTAYVTLHVGAGTFKPVKSNTMQEHDMHAEFIEVKRSLIEQLITHQHHIIAVGTTTLRTLESLYWIGIKIAQHPDIDESLLHVQQWEPYDTSIDLTKKESLTALLTWMDRTKTETLITKTSLLIAPGYNFKCADILITNFHQPRSTLLLLVAAFIGKNWKSVYSYALKNNFRFLSYGDSCLLFKNQI